MTRTERESESRRREEKRACRMPQVSAEKLEHTGSAEKERVASGHRESRWQVRQSRLCQEETEQSRLFRSPDRKAGES